MGPSWLLDGAQRPTSCIGAPHTDDMQSIATGGNVGKASKTHIVVQKTLISRQALLYGEYELHSPQWKRYKRICCQPTLTISEYEHEHDQVLTTHLLHIYYRFVTLLLDILALSAHVQCVANYCRLPLLTMSF